MKWRYPKGLHEKLIHVKGNRRPLHKALTRTYWSMEEAMYYLTYPESHFSQLLDVGRITEAPDSRPGELYLLWRDTDRSQEPRNPFKNSNNINAEFTVSYFVQWAKSKGLRIAWLDWAIAEKLLLPDIKGSQYSALQYFLI